MRKQNVFEISVISSKTQLIQNVWKFKTDAQPAPDSLLRIKSAGTLCRDAKTVCACRAKTLEECKRLTEDPDMLVQSVRFH